MERHDTGLIARLGGRCVATARLPDHPIARLRTGQLDRGGPRWSIELKGPE